MTLKEKIPEIVIGAILVGGGGWLLSQTYTINRALGSLETKVDAKLSEHWGRIDRIASALPDVRVRIAKEELSKSLVTAVVVLDPARNASGKWVTGLHVIDATTRLRNTYFVPAKGPTDKELAWLISGAVLEADPNAVSFKTLSEFSSDVGVPASAPAYVLPQNSFVIRRTSDHYVRFVSEILKGRSTVHRTTRVENTIDTWAKLTTELKQNPNVYMIDER